MELAHGGCTSASTSTVTIRSTADAWIIVGGEGHRVVHDDDTTQLVPVIAAFFVTLAVLAKLNTLPWDRPITEWIVDHRTSGLDDFWKHVTELGGSWVVFVVVAACAVLAWPRCRPLAIAIVVLALVAPVICSCRRRSSLATDHPSR
jgi:hypothetical protein